MENIATRVISDSELQIASLCLPLELVLEVEISLEKPNSNWKKFTFTVDFAKTGPLAKGLVVTNLEDWDLVLNAQGLDQADIVGLVTVLGEDAMKYYKNWTAKGI